MCGKLFAFLALLMSSSDVVLTYLEAYTFVSDSMRLPNVSVLSQLEAFIIRGLCLIPCECLMYLR